MGHAIDLLPEALKQPQLGGFFFFFWGIFFLRIFWGSVCQGKKKHIWKASFQQHWSFHVVIAKTNLCFSLHILQVVSVFEFVKIIWRHALPSSVWFLKSWHGPSVLWAHNYTLIVCCGKQVIFSSLWHKTLSLCSHKNQWELSPGIIKGRDAIDCNIKFSLFA